MHPIDIRKLDNETLLEYANWWCNQLSNWTNILKVCGVKSYTRNFTATLGVLYICDIYIQELMNRELISKDATALTDYRLKCRDFCTRTLENMEDWLYGTERLRTPFIGSD